VVRSACARRARRVGPLADYYGSQVLRGARGRTDQARTRLGEVIDLRTLVPCDYETNRHVEKTIRALVTSMRRGGLLRQHIVDRDRPRSFDRLDPGLPRGGRDTRCVRRRLRRAHLPTHERNCHGNSARLWLLARDDDARPVRVPDLADDEQLLPTVCMNVPIGSAPTPAKSCGANEDRQIYERHVDLNCRPSQTAVGLRRTGILMSRSQARSPQAAGAAAGAGPEKAAGAPVYTTISGVHRAALQPG